MWSCSQCWFVGFEQLSSDAVSNLRKHAIKVLKRCWQTVPADLSLSQKALHRLLPAAGWPLLSLSRDGSSNGASGSSDPTWLPMPSQQAELAAMLLQQVRRHICHMMQCVYANTATTRQNAALQHTIVRYAGVSKWSSVVAEVCRSVTLAHLQALLFPHLSPDFFLQT